MAEAAPTKTAEPTAKPVKMELLRNYVPRNLLRIVGWMKPAVLQKTVAGEMKEIEPAEWREGEAKPAKFAGTGFGETVDPKTGKTKHAKLWAGTVIEVPEDEARDMRKLKIGEAYI